MESKSRKPGPFAKNDDQRPGSASIIAQKEGQTNRPIRSGISVMGAFDGALTPATPAWPEPATEAKARNRVSTARLRGTHRAARGLCLVDLARPNRFAALPQSVDVAKGQGIERS